MICRDAGGTVPTISVFFGIVVRMYYDDHEPPHFDAYYGEHAQEHRGLNRIEPLE
jgi:hypothetical protein